VEKLGRRDSSYEFGTNPCSEIILRPYQFCNLTEVVARDTDTEATLSRKVELATILGTFQATMTDFPYLRNIWKKNTEEERLLGVSITGILDCPLLNNVDDEGLEERLGAMRMLAVTTNKEFASALSIPASASITCVKPSGTVSQLVDSASGIHARHSQYYIRRVRNDNKDPITTFLQGKRNPQRSGCNEAQ
jgi:ribonucleoside-triphosphate reductase (thioredoxin)